MIIRGKKVILRPPILSDAPRNVSWFKDPEFNRFMVSDSLYLWSEKARIECLAAINDWYEFSITDLNAIHIGNTVMDVKPETRCGIYSIYIGDKTYWNRGLGQETTALMLQLSFGELQLKSVELQVFAGNHRAVAAYKKCGFEVIKSFRKNYRSMDQQLEAYQMAICQADWLAKQAA